MRCKFRIVPTLGGFRECLAICNLIVPAPAAGFWQRRFLRRALASFDT
jgi:hypothetical protein